MTLFHHKPRNFTMIVGSIMLCLLFVACGSANTGGPSGTTPAPPGVTNGKGGMKVGVLFPETATSARWDGGDRPALQADIPQLLPGPAFYYNNSQGKSDSPHTQAQ